MANANVIELGGNNFDTQIQEGLTLVDFWAEWCGPCKALAPTVDRLADQYQDRVKVGKFDVDSNQAIPGKYGIRGIPTLILFKDGTPIDQTVGNNPQQIEAMLERHVS